MPNADSHLTHKRNHEKAVKIDNRKQTDKDKKPFLRSQKNLVSHAIDIKLYTKIKHNKYSFKAHLSKMKALSIVRIS